MEEKDRKREDSEDLIKAESAVDEDKKKSEVSTESRDDGTAQDIEGAPLASETQEGDTQPDDEPEGDTRSLGEKIEDTMDEVVARTQEFFYGERHSMAEDLIATMPDPDTEIRHVNKVQTRRNINKKILGKKGAKIFLVIVAVVMVIGLIVHFIG